MIPEHIGRYEVRALAGSGGFATVFEGFDPRLDARVAIKVLADNKSRMPEVRRRFRQEAVLLRRMRAEEGVPGLIEVFDIDETETGQPFFVMGWADRGTIHDRQGLSPWTPDAVLPLIQALTQSLGNLHGAGVVHRDVKPQNVLLRAERGAEPAATGRIARGERILLGDLGLAKDLSSDTSAMSVIGGTEGYTAPEQLQYGASVDHRADIFAATRMVEELLRGRDQTGRLSEALQSVVDRGSAPDRENRQATMQQWQEEMARSLQLPEQTPAPQVLAERRSIAGLRTSAVAVLAVIVVAAAGLWSLTRSSSPITGPATILSGESAAYSFADEEFEDVRWTDPTGATVVAESLTIVGRLPGEVRFSGFVDGELFERAIIVEPSPRGPEIIGPDQVALGQSGTYRASVPNGDSFYWIHPVDGVVDAESILVEQRDDEFVVGLIWVDARGVERGQQLRVVVNE